MLRFSFLPPRLSEASACPTHSGTPPPLACSARRRTWPSSSSSWSTKKCAASSCFVCDAGRTGKAHVSMSAFGAADYTRTSSLFTTANRSHVDPNIIRLSCQVL
jgi:hypothetical protein